MPASSSRFTNTKVVWARRCGLTVSATLTQPSVSAGVGLIYLFDPMRMELNFGVTLAMRTSDGMQKACRLALGSNFYEYLT